MKKYSTILFALVSAIMMVAGNSWATTISFESDTDFLANADFTKYFGGNVRWGYNESPRRSWEYSVVDANDMPLDQKEVVWPESEHSYLFSYDGSNTATLDINGIDDSVGTVATDSAPINALAFRARASDDRVSIMFADIRIEFSDSSEVLLGELVGDSDAQYILLVDPRLSEGFLVYGDAQLEVNDGSNPGSDPMYGFKVGQVTDQVPEPTTLLLLGSGLIGLGVFTRKRFFKRL